jgi:hypothetical protein
VPSRREFISTCLRAGLAAPFARLALPLAAPSAPLTRFSDLRRHFVLEYYPWYGTMPWRHWDQWDRHPPEDIASHYVPLLGPYDSRSRSVIEQHARWIADAGVGAINLSWWGRGSFEDRCVPIVMDVMHDHDLKVAFHLEAYAPNHAYNFADDVRYLLREYGDKRAYDALLVLQDASGRSGPVFKTFHAIILAETTDCHDVTLPDPSYAPDTLWARQIEDARGGLRRDFDHVTFLTDSTDMTRSAQAGYDGIAVYGSRLEPSDYAPLAVHATGAGLLFSFNCNPGLDKIDPRILPPDSCYTPAPFVPAAPSLDWTRAEDRQRAADLAQTRIRHSLLTSLRAQVDPTLSNADRGFLLVYVNSWNEWHEGTMFEPMQDHDRLDPVQKTLGYHSAAAGGYRLSALAAEIRGAIAQQAELLQPVAPDRPEHTDH